MKDYEYKIRMIYKIVEAWTSDEELEHLSAGANIIMINKIVKEIIKNIEPGKEYKFYKHYGEELSISLDSGSLSISSRDYYIRVFYLLWETYPTIEYRITENCIERLQNFTDSLIKYEGKIIRDIKNIGNE